MPRKKKKKATRKKKPKQKKQATKKRERKKQTPVAIPLGQSEGLRQVRVPFRKGAPYKAKYYLRRYSKKKKGKIFTYVHPVINLTSELILILGWTNKTQLVVERTRNGIYLSPIQE